MKVLLTIIGICFVARISGACFRSELKSEMTASQRVRFFCEYTEQGKTILKLLPGSKLILADQCMDCSCTSEGLSCCGFGRAAGVVSFPDNCEALNDGCQTIPVLKENHNVSCANETIDYDALANQLPHPDNRYGLMGNTAGHSIVYTNAYTGPTTPATPSFDMGNMKSRLYEYLSSMFPGGLPSSPGGISNYPDTASFSVGDPSSGNQPVAFDPSSIPQPTSDPTSQPVAFDPAGSQPTFNPEPNPPSTNQFGGYRPRPPFIPLAPVIYPTPAMESPLNSLLTTARDFVLPWMVFNGAV